MNGFLFGEIISELYDDLKIYIFDKYFTRDYGNESIVIRDLNVDINNYILPIVGEKLTKKLLNELDLKLVGDKVKKFIFNKKNNLLSVEVNDKVYNNDY